MCVLNATVFLCITLCITGEKGRITLDIYIDISTVILVFLVQKL